MNEDTGKIREFASAADALQEGFHTILPHKPNPDCMRCGGTGSRKNLNGKYVPCRSCYEVPATKKDKSNAN